MKTILALLLLTHAGSASPIRSFDVRMFGAIGDAKTKDTAAFQRALDAASTAGGGDVEVPPGEYLIGSIELKSNTTLQLSKDAHLIGSSDMNDYPITKVRWEGRWVDGHRGLIYAQGAKHIGVIGPGKISGTPTLRGRQTPREPALIEPINSSDITLDGFSAEQRLMWAIHPTYSDDIEIRNLTIRTTGGNGDGIDIDSCRHVKIEYCDIDSGDDAIAIKSGRGMEGLRAGRLTEDVLISHCTLGDSIFAAIGIGSETSGGIRNIRIEHVKVTHAKTYAFYIKSRVGRGAFIEDISVNDMEVGSEAEGFLRISLLTSGLQDAEPVTGEAGIPATKNFSFTNIKVNGGTLVDAVAVSPEKPIQGFTLTNVTGTVKKGIALANVANAKIRDIHVTGYDGGLITMTNVTESK
ncbi:MAG TPA: glycosyl hydrolase family 28 protein [Terriglobia bacterium]|nr:glycosyl hydrolase family 28 protein [Terriglobia bacterium]